MGINSSDPALYTIMDYHIINTCDVALWGVPQVERIRKVLAKAGNFNEILDVSEVQSGQNILILRADYLYEANVIQKLVGHSKAILTSSCNENLPTAVWCSNQNVLDAVKLLANESSDSGLKSLNAFSPQQLTGGYDPRLRKYDLAHVVHINNRDKTVIENYLYDKSYKGITDLVTKWWWPLPARGVVRKCVSAKITPNMVTGFGWILTIIAGIAFFYGELVLGLLAAWVMTFLDTVDGKLARVTLQSSKIGHVMDHGLDIIHPPIWYWCWATGLGVSQITFMGISLTVLDWVWLMLAAYVGGRVFEGLFQLLFNDISIFCWKPIDSFHRLITARRNPCIIMLTVAVLIADPELGFMWVVAWSVISTLVLAIRFLMACLERIFNGPLESWVENINPDKSDASLAVRMFTGYPAQKTIAPLLNATK
ncbi:MAG: CDP-alcohol phosphatidyltransferase family protein [Gammaproteobacteria bacterium]|nr:CDP-alcohol phosphatidyltransferase family protein [Gammaproteobacteria bacterium]